MRNNRLTPLLLLAFCVAPIARAQDNATPTYVATLRASYLPLDLVRGGAVRMPRPLTRAVTLRRDEVLLQQVLLEIATQAGLGLSYGEDLARSNTLVSVELNAAHAAEALAAAVKGTKWAVLVNASGQIAVVPSSVAVLSAVSGTVVDKATTLPVSGASVTLDGTAFGATTDESGRFRIASVPAGTYTATARRIGYTRTSKPITVSDGPLAIDFALDAAASVLDQVVVTGVPIATSKRTLGNAITTVNAAQETKQAIVTNVNELLGARAPGVTVMQSSGTPGTSGTVRIRGVGSLASTTDPVVYVDGVRIASGAAGNFRNSWETPATGDAKSPTKLGGGQDASLLSSISPEDIESVEVIKGPAAATLYGADAANGVIQIITKRGKLGQQANQWRVKAQRGQTDWALDRRTSYTTCTAERAAAKLPDGTAAWPGCQGAGAGSVLSLTSLDAPGVLRTGNLGDYTLSLTGGGKGYSYFTAADHDQEQGVWANSDTKRSTARANFQFYPTDRVNYAVNFAYGRNDTRFPMGDNGTNMLESAWTFQPGASLNRGQTDGFAAGSPDQIAIYDNRLLGDHLTFGTTLNVQPIAWFTNRLTAGADLTSSQANRYIAPGSLWAPVEGQMTQGAPRNNVYNVDYAGTVSTALPLTHLTSALSFGAQYTNKQYRNTISQGNNFPSSSTRDIGLAAVHSGWTEYVDVKTLGMYAQEQLGWADRVFVTGALRIDNSSVFGNDIKQLYYPKVSVAYVVSEEPAFKKLAGTWLDQLKLRAAYGQAGNAPDPFAAVRSYTSAPNVDNTTGAAVPMLQLNTRGNPDVKPERGSEIELGFDAGLFGGRASAELTYYDKTTKDALMMVPNAPSDGFPGGTYQNLGEINNRGIEMSISATPVQTRFLEWDARLGLSRNANKLVRFGYKRGPMLFGLTTQNQRNAEGYPLGGFWVHDPVKQADGSYAAGDARYVGAADPTREASIANTFTFLGRVHLYGLLDYKGGYWITNQTDWRRCSIGVCEQVNDPSVSAEQKKLLQLDLTVNDALYTQRGDFLKLRDLSVAYDVPSGIVRRFGASRASLVAAGHNLAILWKHGYTGLDPEVNFSGANGPTGAFGLTRVDYWTMPMTRRLTVALDVGF